MNQRTSIFLLRIVAIFVILATLALSILQLRVTPDLNGPGVLLPIAVFVFGLGVGAILLGLGEILQERDRPIDAAPVDLAQHQLVDVAMKVEELRLNMDRLVRLQESNPPMAQVHTEREGPPPLADPAIGKILQELRELSVLPEEQRAKLWQQSQEQRKQVAKRAALRLIEANRWQEAEQAIVQFENEWRNDSEVSALRKELDSARERAEAQAIHDAQAQIESAMSLSQWDQAQEMAQQLTNHFPKSEFSAKLLARVQREKSIYTETMVNRLFEEIRHDVERRIWRRALDHAQQLLTRFPTHSKSDLIRKQIHTIQSNAEIEERQEQELRIGELIRARRFDEAIVLSENLLARFPNSPQAQAIEKMLPRVRQLASESEHGAAHASSG